MRAVVVRCFTVLLEAKFFDDVVDNIYRFCMQFLKCKVVENLQNPEQEYSYNVKLCLVGETVVVAKTQQYVLSIVELQAVNYFFRTQSRCTCNHVIR